MLQEENEDAFQALVRSVNDIEQGVDRYQPPSLENVSMHDYASASVDQHQRDSAKKRAWLRPFVATVGVLLLLGVVALVGVTLWTPTQLNKEMMTTTIDIEVWEGDFDEPSQSQTPMEQLRDHFGEPFEPAK